MGVPDLWDIVKPAIQPRIPLSVFASDFYRTNHRPLKVAIDSYIWIFETGHVPNSPTNETNPYKVLQGFISRICQLISCHISFVIVFDGLLKPSFKQNFVLDDATNLQNFQQLYQGERGLVDSGDIVITVLKKAFDQLNISYIDAAGEAESECSRLQNIGVVDFVLSNDSDSMLFGCTKILKNFSKIYENNEQDEYYVDPVDMDFFYKQNRIDRFRLIFFAILRGADYNAGIDKIGTERAKRIAFVDTMLDKTTEGCADFCYEFQSIFYNGYKAWEKLPDLETVETQYNNLILEIALTVSVNSVAFFGRNDKISLSSTPAYYIAILYFYPILSKLIFKFTSGTLNYQGDEEEKLHINNDTIPQLRSFKSKDSVIRFTRDGGGLKGKIGISDYNKDNKELVHDIISTNPNDKILSIRFNQLINDVNDKLPNVTNTRNYICSKFAKCLLMHSLTLEPGLKDGVYIKQSKLKLLPSRGEIARLVKIDYDSETDDLTKWNIKMYMFKFKPELILKEFMEGIKTEIDDHVWVSEQMLMNLQLTRYITLYEETRLLSTPRKRQNSQTSTLESLGYLSLSPTKELMLRSPTKLMNSPRRESILRSPSKVIKSPKKSPKKSSYKKNTLEFGQSPITNFFKNGKELLSSRLNDDDEDVVINLV